MEMLAPIQFQHYSSASKRAADIIARELKEAGHQVFYVGGWVRDLLLNQENDDIDIATSASPQQLLELFPNAIQVGIAFGVIRLIVNNIQFEIATFRQDGEYLDGRHPIGIDCSSSPKDDAIRRDFSINGLFYDPFANTILDYVGGIQDIKLKLIRAIGDPVARFTEDKLRVLRAIRFKNRFGFSFEKTTWLAIEANSKDVISTVSPERVWQEIEKMSQKNILGDSLADMRKTALFNALFPELKGRFESSISDRLAHIDQISRFLHKTSSTVIPVILIALLIPIELASTRLLFIDRFRLSNKEKKALETFSQVEKVCKEGFAQKSEREIVSLLALPYALDSLFAIEKLSSEKMRREGAFARKAFNELQFWIIQLQERSFYITGEDFLQKGVLPGKKIGVLIEKAFALSLALRIKEKEPLIAEVLHCQAQAKR